MRFYDAIRPALFCLDAERAHGAAITALKWGLGPKNGIYRHPKLKTDVLGLTFENPVGLAAGFDKNAEVMGAMLQAGFGFVEAGTVTPLAQPGNPRPRLFRLLEDQAVINRMGFNNEGLAAFRARLIHYQDKAISGGIVGANIGANKTTEDQAVDYVSGLKGLGALPDYFTVNISSPNTPGLRGLQGREALTDLLSRVMQARTGMIVGDAPAKPVLVKIAPDLSPAECEDIAEVVMAQNVDGLIISNTTIGGREALMSQHRHEAGGLSGQPVFDVSTSILSTMYNLTDGKLPLIGVGGISNGQQAYAKIRAGASLVQLYSAMVYEGPGLSYRICDELLQLLAADGFASVAEAVGTDYR